MNKMVYAAAAVILTAVVGCALCAPKGVVLDLHPETSPPAPAAEPSDPWAWANEAWTGNDKPYQQIRASIDKKAALGISPLALAHAYEPYARQKPADRQLQFQWGYAAYLGFTREADSGKRHWKFKELNKTLAYPVSPRVYNYDRLRFLIAEDDSHLVPLGDRLIQRDPSDAEVKNKEIGNYYALITITGRKTKQVDPKLKARALAIAEELIQSNPATPKYHASLGGVYLTCWMISKDQEDAQKALAAYQQYLRLAPPNDEFRPQALNLIHFLEKGTVPVPPGG